MQLLAAFRLLVTNGLNYILDWRSINRVKEDNYPLLAEQCTTMRIFTEVLQMGVTTCLLKK